MMMMLRVNSFPTANKAALLSVANATTPPKFVDWVDLPGGHTKFTIRYHAKTQRYYTLSNYASDESITPNPACVASQNGTTAASAAAKPTCCSISHLSRCTSDNCLWCHGEARNVLVLASSGDLIDWKIEQTVLQDDTGLAPWTSMLYTGFQYVDWQFDGDTDIVMLVRTSYRGANSCHNANRLTFKRIALTVN
eukprot:TRINITY_DN68050_c2_g1_i1.p2 TRINITY_DN68050_c2_g1~~TRINITY_DN68050_c2_g1_i1.p2  ORF type:complete len:194 (-),score=78.74 TRINITY_DN68050_c2_g1_i1:217-798(-)